MLRDMKSRKITGLQLTKREVTSTILPQVKFSDENWDSSNKLKVRISCDQTKLAQRLISESERMIDEVTEKKKNWQREVDHQLRERSSEVNFLTDELNKQKKTASMEEEALSHYRNRILKAIDYLKKTLAMNQECMQLRAGRIGVDLCTDDVERQLIQELKTIKGCQDMMDKTLKETNEQLQRLRAAIYLLDKDIGQKSTALRIDNHNLTLREFQHNLGQGKDLSQHLCKYTLAEWQTITAKNIESNAKELHSASELRAYIDLLLKQIFEDLQNQTDRTNDAFRRRIRETREIKHFLEEKHADCMVQITKLDNNINRLQQELADRQRSLTLCQTRLSNRALRPDLELTCDIAQQALYDELNHLQCTLAKLNQKLAENKAMLRYMTHTHLMQEEEINIKTNTLKIDEVDCQTLRQTLKYTPF